MRFAKFEFFTEVILKFKCASNYALSTGIYVCLQGQAAEEMWPSGQRNFLEFLSLKVKAGNTIFRNVGKYL